MDEESNYPVGTPMCCDYAKYADGSYQCILYTGDNTIDVNKDDFPDDTFLAFTFTHGVYSGSGPTEGSDDTEEERPDPERPAPPNEGPPMMEDTGSKMLTLSMTILSAGYMTLF